jgi:hypothetical protein
MKLEFSQQIFEKSLNVKFRPVGAKEQTDMTQLIFAFRNFAKAPKNESLNAV